MNLFRVVRHNVLAEQTSSSLLGVTSFCQKPVMTKTSFIHRIANGLFGFSNMESKPTCSIMQADCLVSSFIQEFANIVSIFNKSYNCMMYNMLSLN